MMEATHGAFERDAGGVFAWKPGLTFWARRDMWLVWSEDLGVLSGDGFSTWCRRDRFVRMCVKTMADAIAHDIFSQPTPGGSVPGGLGDLVK